jgi:hypothetical protein
MNEERLKEIEDGCNAATPARWWVEYREVPLKDGSVFHEATVTTEDTDIAIVYTDVDKQGELNPDAMFIAAARFDVPELLAEVRRLQKLLTVEQGVKESIIEDRNGWREEARNLRRQVRDLEELLRKEEARG